VCGCATVIKVPRSSPVAFFLPAGHGPKAFMEGLAGERFHDCLLVILIDVLD
jgi:hypothetical protein